MARNSPSYTKIIIRHCFIDLVDPELSASQRDEIWDYFDNHCAYCGKKLSKNRHEGHLDHLDPSSLGGSNYIGNRVLACAVCNEEKRDRFWPLFLKEKAHSDERKRKIKSWQQRFPTQNNKLNPQYIEYANKLADEVIRDLDIKIDKLRKKMREL